MTDGAREALLRRMHKESVVDRIIKRLTNTIISGDLKPGDQIPTEIELSLAMGVGRNSVREAVKALVAMGILNIRRAEGTFVAEGFSNRMLEPITYGLILEGGNTPSVIELRQIFDTGVIQLAIAKAKPEDIRALNEHLDTMRMGISENPSYETLQNLDLAFHKQLEHIADNPLVEKFSAIIQRISLPSRDKAVQVFIDKKELDKFLALHSAIVSLVERQDPAGISEVMNRHYQYWSRVLSKKEES